MARASQRRVRKGARSTCHGRGVSPRGGRDGGPGPRGGHRARSAVHVRQRAHVPGLEPDGARARGGRARHRAAAAAVPRRPGRPPPARRPADRARRGARGRRLRRMGAQPARAAPRRPAAAVGHAVDPRRDDHRDRGHRRRRPADLGRCDDRAADAEPPPPSRAVTAATTRRSATPAWPASARRWPGRRTALSFAALGGVDAQGERGHRPDHPRDRPGRSGSSAGCRGAGSPRPGLPTVGATRLFRYRRLDRRGIAALPARRRLRPAPSRAPCTASRA